MKKLWSKFSGALKRALSSISLVDKFLLVIMLILLAQSAYSAIEACLKCREESDVDIIIRTSAASVFGYFLSGNFIKAKPRLGSPQSPQAPTEPDLSRSEPQAVGKIGFAAEERSEEASEPPVLPAEALPTHTTCGRLQISVVALTGIFSLIILIAVKDYAGLSPMNAYSVAQFRDFVSASVGFLVGCGKEGIS